MKLYSIIKSLALPVALTAAMAGCSDDFDYPPTVVPEADHEANTTIAQLKNDYWSLMASNGNQEIGLTPAGDSIYIKARIISSDASGNIYNNLIVEDETEAITLAIKASNMYENYKYGQNIVINLTGLHIGGYRSLMQVGAINDKNEMTFMDEDVFTSRVQRDGMPDLTAIDTLSTTIPDLQLAKTTAEGIREWQSRLIKIEELKFVDGGKTTFGDYSDPSKIKSANRYAVDADGNRINVRCSGYATFGHDIIPTGTGSITGILSMYDNDWQLLMIDVESMQGFDNADQPGSPGETVGNGSADAPFTVGDILGGATGTEIWTTGYIVGWVDGLDIAEGAKFDSNATNNTNILIAGAADEKDINKCLPVQLPAGTIRSALNLVEHPENLGKQVSLKANTEIYFKVTGLKETSAYTWGAKGEEPEKPVTSDLRFRKATSVSSGKLYVMVNAAGKVAIPIKETFSYGYLYVEDPKATEGDVITTTSANAITFTASGTGFTMRDSYGRYLSMDNVESHKSFQLYTSPEAGSVWTVAAEADGTFKIVNESRPTFTVNWVNQYNNFSPATSGDGLPMLYEQVTE